jgi:hypothetical protein
MRCEHPQAALVVSVGPGETLGIFRALIKSLSHRVDFRKMLSYPYLPPS